MKFMLKVWLAIILGPILLWLGGLMLMGILPQIGLHNPFDTGTVSMAVVVVLAVLGLAWVSKRQGD